MKKEIFMLIDKLAESHSLENHEYEKIIAEFDDESATYLAKKALLEKQKYYGNKIYIRGLIEISNICKNDCYYCGIRKSNDRCERYRLTQDEILASCRKGYELGFRTFVLQGGEDGYFTDNILTELIENIKSQYPDCAVTLSLGERSEESYRLLKAAGADRYLLRHETIAKEHYEKLHPLKLTLENRLSCLKTLRKLDFQVGCGFMVGSPYQTKNMLAQELKFIEEFKPDMCGIGPFIPHKDTPFSAFPSGSVSLTCVLLSCIRLIHPTVLLPATTALATVDPTGRQKGILSGANVVMPNLSPESVRKKYTLYDNKLSDGEESAQAIDALNKQLNSIGCHIEIGRGDVYKTPITKGKF